VVLIKCTNLPYIQKYRHDGRYLTVNLFIRTNKKTEQTSIRVTKSRSKFNGTLAEMTKKRGPKDLKNNQLGDNYLFFNRRIEDRKLFIKKSLHKSLIRHSRKLHLHDDTRDKKCLMYHYIMSIIHF
jgi:hypothetical protein